MNDYFLALLISLIANAVLFTAWRIARDQYSRECAWRDIDCRAYEQLLSRYTTKGE